MNNSKEDSLSSASKGGWWSRLSQYQQIVAAIVGALVTGLFGVLIVLIGSSLGAKGSSPASVASPPVTSGPETGKAPPAATPSPGPAAADAPPASSASARGQYLADLTPVSGNVHIYTGSATVNGSNYLNSVMLYMALGGRSIIENKIESQWRSLEATVGL